MLTLYLIHQRWASPSLLLKGAPRECDCQCQGQMIRDFISPPRITSFFFIWFLMYMTHAPILQVMSKIMGVHGNRRFVVPNTRATCLLVHGHFFSASRFHFKEVLFAFSQNNQVGFCSKTANTYLCSFSNGRVSIEITFFVTDDPTIL